MTNTTEQKVAPAFYDAGSGYHIIIAKVDAGKFQVFLSDPHRWHGAFYGWHSNGIRRGGAEALARWLAEGTRDYLAEIAKATTPQEQEYVGAALGIEFDPDSCDRIAQDFDAAAALMPYLDHTPDPWGLAEKIAKARPWEAPDRFQCHDLSDDVPF